MQKLQNNISRISIVGGIATIISVILFFTKGIGSVVLAQKSIGELKEFQEKQEIINTEAEKQFSSINTNLDWIKDYLKAKL